MKKSKIKKVDKKKKQEDDAEGFFIPAGVLLGIGFGFLYGNVPAGLFIGLGLGFVAFAISNIILKLKNKKK